MSKIAVIVARYQAADVHPGQYMLIQYAQANSDKVLFVLGEAPVLSRKNPLPFAARKMMLEELLGVGCNYEIVKLNDCRDDEEGNKVWSQDLDLLIRSKTLNDDVVTLYTGRDGFSKKYSGFYQDNVVERDFSINHVSATLSREAIFKKGPQKCHEWREGFICAIFSLYPTSYQAVDNAPIRKTSTGEWEVLLGRKPKESLLRFIGGFSDPKDSSLTVSARRETKEECGNNFEVDSYKILDSFRVDDWRFRDTEHKIMTLFHVSYHVFGLPKPNDDIAEVKWALVNDLTPAMIVAEHHMLLECLKNFLKSEAEKEAKFEEAVEREVKKRLANSYIA